MALQSMTALASITLQQASTSVSFSGIPQNYRDLVLVVSGTISGSQGNNWLYFNNDTTHSNYSFVRMLGTGSSTSSTLSTSGENNGPSVSDMTPTQNQVIVQVMDYSATDKHKTRLSRSDQPSSTTIAYASRWASTAAVNSLTFAGGNGGNLVSGTTLNLYGRIA
jgi:hypothetical protein